jgi:hypothetical protein
MMISRLSALLLGVTVATFFNPNSASAQAPDVAGAAMGAATNATAPAATSVDHAKDAVDHAKGVVEQGKGVVDHPKSAHESVKKVLPESK